VKDDRIYLNHIIENCDLISKHIGGDKSKFLNDPLIKDASLRNLQTLAESSSHLSAALKQTHPEIDWKGIAGFRNVLVHDYLGIDPDIVWDVIERDLPVIRRAAHSMIQKLDKNVQK